MKKYELLLVLPGTLDENEAAARSNEVLAMVKEKDEKAELQTLGKTRLAYPIRQIRYGYFYTIVFSVEVEVLKELQTKFNLMRDALRAMVTEYNEKFSTAQKISYTTNDTGITTVSTEEAEEEAVVTKAEKDTKKPEEKISMQDIDKKLDEILAGDIIPGV